MDISFNDDTVKEIVTAAIMKQLGDSDTLVADAIKYLISTKKVGSGYDAKEVQPLQQAFHTAIERHATHVIMEFLKDNEELNVQIRDLSAEVLKQTFAVPEGSYSENESGGSLAFLIASEIQKRISKAANDRY